MVCTLRCAEGSVWRTLPSPRDSGSVSHLTQDSACPPQFAQKKRESGTPAALRPGLTAPPPLRGSISDRAHHTSALNLWPFRGSRPFRGSICADAFCSTKRRTVVTAKGAPPRGCYETLSSLRDSENFPAVPSTPPAHPGCGSVLGLDIPCLRHSDSCNMFHRRNKEQSFVASHGCCAAPRSGPSFSAGSERRALAQFCRRQRTADPSSP